MPYILVVGLFNSDPFGVFWPLGSCAQALSLFLCGRKIGGRGWKDRGAKNRSHYSIITAYRLLLGNGIRLTLIIILSHFLLFDVPSFLGSLLHSSAEPASQIGSHASKCCRKPLNPLINTSRFRGFSFAAVITWDLMNIGEAQPQLTFSERSGNVLSKRYPQTLYQ